MTVHRWPALLMGVLLGRATRRRAVVEIELVLPSDAEVLEVSSTAHGAGFVILYDDGRPDA